MGEPANCVCDACGQAFPDEQTLDAHVRDAGLVD